MENNKFNAFMVFMAVVLTVFFLSLKVQFLVALICSLICVILIRACWLVFGLFWRLLEGVSFNGARKEYKRFKG